MQINSFLQKQIFVLLIAVKKLNSIFIIDFDLEGRIEILVRA